jgi:FtsH-binding integral membrane protein
MSVDPYLGYTPVIRLEEKARARFVMRTYLHLLGAFVAFVLLEVMFFTTGLAAPMAKAMLSFSWLLVLGLFIVFSWIASRFAHNAESLGVQYIGLAAYVIAEAVIFVPLLYIAETFAPGVLQSSVALTLVGFAGLTVIAFVTRTDFSFLRGLLYWGGVVAVILILGGLLFQWKLGTYFAVGMIALAGASILYDTSNVLHHFPEDRYVGAALELFASVALLLWYIIQFQLLSRD